MNVNHLKNNSVSFQRKMQSRLFPKNETSNGGQTSRHARYGIFKGKQGPIQKKELLISLGSTHRTPLNAICR